MKLFLKILWVIVPTLSLFFLFSCESDEQVEQTIPPHRDTIIVKDTVKIEPTKPEKKVDAEMSIKINFSAAEAKALFLIDSLPIGSSYAKSNNMIQGLSKLNKVNGTAKTTFTLNGDLAIVTLQFVSDSLQSITYVVEKKKSAEAEYYFKAVRNFYSKKIGEFEKEQVEEESRFSPAYDFDYKGVQLTIFNNINEGTVSWTFE